MSQGAQRLGRARALAGAPGPQPAARGCKQVATQCLAPRITVFLIPGPRWR